MKKKYLLIFNVIFTLNCINEPKPSLNNSLIFNFYIYSIQEGCSYYSINKKNERLEYCTLYKFSVCSQNGWIERVKKQREIIIQGLKSIASEIDDCIIDAFDEIQFLNTLNEKSDPYYSKVSETPEIDSFLPNLGCNNFISSERMSFEEIENLNDPSIYLAIFAKNNNCSRLIPLSISAREFVSNYKEGSKKLFTQKK